MPRSRPKYCESKRSFLRSFFPNYTPPGRVLLSCSEADLRPQPYPHFQRPSVPGSPTNLQRVDSTGVSRQVAENSEAQDDQDIRRDRSDLDTSGTSTGRLNESVDSLVLDEGHLCSCLSRWIFTITLLSPTSAYNTKESVPKPDARSFDPDLVGRFRSLLCHVLISRSPCFPTKDDFWVSVCAGVDPHSYCPPDGLGHFALIDGSQASHSIVHNSALRSHKF